MTLLFSTLAYQPLRDAMAREGRFTLGQIEREHFPDGERYMRFLSDIDDRDLVLLGGTISDTDTLEIYDLACSAVKYGARSLTLVIPYFGYSTMERAVHPGEVVTAKTRARLFSSIPEAARGNRVVLVDLHTEGLPHYFEGGIRPLHLYAKSVVTEAAKRLGEGNFVLACTDAGRAKWVESLANTLGIDASFVFKRRTSGERTQVTAVSAQVEGRRVVIYDDMIRTGGSLMQAAAAYRAAGASSIAAVTTHGLFPGDALERIKHSGLFTSIVATDSHPRATELAATSGGFLEVASIAGLLADCVEQFVGSGTDLRHG